VSYDLGRHPPVPRRIDGRTELAVRDEVAELCKELAAARAELERLRATQRDPDATLNSSRKSAFCKRGSVNVRFAPKATECCVAAN
jgi:hypothetical protein